MTRMLVEILTATFEIQRNHNDLSYQERMKPVVFIKQDKVVPVTLTE